MNIRIRQLTQSILCVLAMSALLATTATVAAGPQKTTIVIAPLKSNVPDISALAARTMLIKALAKTSQFAIPSQASATNIPGVQYVVDGVIAEAKATASNKTNAMTFLRSMTADNLISLEVRVFDARTMALVDTISVKSADINKSSKFGAEDAMGLLGALAKGVPSEGGNASDAGADSQQMEQRLEPLVTDLANQLAARYGAGAMQTQPSQGFPFGLMPNTQQQQPAQGFAAPTQPSQRGRR
jgi:hypothetical protein